MPDRKKKFDPSEIVQAIMLHLDEARQAKQKRMKQNQFNWDCYHMNWDFGDKREGQSTQFLPKLFVAVERAVSVLKKALINFDKWVEVETNARHEVFDPETIRKVLVFYLDGAETKVQITDTIKNALLESLATVKVHGEFVKKAVFEAVETEVAPAIEEIDLEGNPLKPREKAIKRSYQDAWKLKIDVIGAEDFFPDPTGQGLFYIHKSKKDLFRVKQLSTGENSIYKKSEVDKLSGGSNDAGQEQAQKDSKQDKEDQKAPSRKMVDLVEFCGTLISPSTGEVIAENCVATVADDKFLIRGPEDNPFWHGESPYVTAPLIRVHETVWHKAIMDAPAYLNIAQTELFNMMLDGGMNAASNATEINSNWLEDPSQVSNGIRPGDSLKKKATAPVGVPAVTVLKLGDVPADALNMYNLLDTEFQSSAFTNDVGMGQTPGKTTTATAVAEASNSITGLFDSFARDFEDSFIEELLKKAHLTIWQNLKYIDQEELIALLGEAKAQQINAMDPVERFAIVANMARFRCKGLSAVLNRFRDVARFSQIMQMLGSSPDLLMEFKKKYSFQRLLGEFVMAIGLDESKLMLSEEEEAQVQQEQQQMQAEQKQMALMEMATKMKPGPKPGADFENMNASQNPEVVGGGAQQVNQELGGLR